MNKENSPTGKKKKKVVATAIAVVLAAALMIGGTISYLMGATDDLVNTFTRNSNSVDITESTGNDYDIVPGTSDEKDPTVTASATVDSYLYLVVYDNTDGLVDYEIDTSVWTLLYEVDDEGNYTGGTVYYTTVSAGTTNGTYNVLKDQTVYYSADITNEDLADIESLTLSFEAYIIQQASFEVYDDDGNLNVSGSAKNALAYAYYGINDEDVEKIVYVSSAEELEEALSSLSSGDYIILTSDVTTDSAITIKGVDNVTIDLAGYNLTCDSDTAISITNASVTITDSSSNGSGTISGTSDSNNSGGVITVSGGTLTVTGGTISGTTTTDGTDDGSYTAGAVYVGNSGTFDFTGGTINDSSAAGYMGAGAVYVTGGSTFTMSDGAEITGCESTNTSSGSQYCAGAVIVTSSSTFTMTGGTISDCSLGADNQYGTGGVLVDNSTFTMSGGTVSSCTGSRGGAVLVKGSSGEFNLSGGTLSGNTATYSGGAIYIYSSGTMTMSSGSITSNTCSSGKGGGIRACSGTTVTITGGTISGNTADSGNNAYIDSGCTLTDESGVLTDYTNANN